MKNYIVFFVVLLSSFVSQATIKLALNWKPEAEFGGFYEAQQKGYFTNEKLKVEILEGGSGTPTIQMLMNGTVDYAIVSAEEVILSAARDPKKRIVAVFAVFETSPYMIMAHDEVKAQSLQQLFQDSQQLLSLQKGLPYVDFLLNKYAPVKAKIVPYTGGISLFESNPMLSQQGFITSEVLLAEQKKLKVKTWLVADEGFNPYITVLAVREDYLQKNKSQVQAFIKATRDGWQSYLKDSKATNQLMSKKNPPMSIEMMDLSLKKMQPLMRFAPALLGQMKAERWQALQTQMQNLGLIKTTVPATELFQTF
ncbi:MAG: ABC transporter substrate-binding protein [Bdellovibrionaceae bacterium]|nr:ABC transporter substrate-binding protein [Bdellovibrio sp.]